MLARVLASLPLCATVLLAASSVSGEVKEADATCRTATAILLTGTGQEAELAWSKIREVTGKSTKWKEVREAPQDRVGEIALTRFDIRHTYKGGPTVAYTVQCGHGGTCNEVATEFRAKFPALTPAPTVQCGDVSNMLTNPAPAP